MVSISRSLVTIVVTTVVVALLGYWLGFAMLFAHTAAEIFWYGLLFGGLNILALSAGWFFVDKKNQETSKSSNNSAPASAGI